MKYLYRFFYCGWYPMSYRKVEFIRETKTLIIAKEDGKEIRYKKAELMEYEELRKRWNRVKSHQMQGFQQKILILESEMLPEEEPTK